MTPRYDDGWGGDRRVTDTRKTAAWHAVDVSEAVALAGTDPARGLAPAEAARRLDEHGANELPKRPPTPMWKRLLGQLRGMLIAILLIAVGVSMFLGDWIEAGIILGIVLLNALVGAVQESRAEKALQGLQQMAAPEARVLRDGVPVLIPARDLVPGDVVLLDAGVVIPADLRLVEDARLQIDESSLTGESVPVVKDSGTVVGAEAVIGDRINCAFMGTVVTYGRGLGLVTETGGRTELGRIAEAIEEPEGATPLQRKLDEFGRVMGSIVLAVCGLVFVVGVLRDAQVGVLFREGLGTYLAVGRETVVGLFVIAVGLAVAAVPEGLPAVVTMSLALGTREMLQRNALVRRLPSVETLGSATVICTDKTGTLTENRMTVVQAWAAGTSYEVTGRGYSPEGEILVDGVAVSPDEADALRETLWAGLLCNDASLELEPEPKVLGDPTEGALLVAAGKIGLTLSPEDGRLGEIPFDSDRKRMTTIHRGEGALADSAGAAYVALVKGAPDSILACCSRVRSADGVADLDPAKRREIDDVNRAMGENGLRVLAVAYRGIDSLSEDVGPEVVETDLILLGLVAMQDPPREEVADAVRTAGEAGLRTIMITGDHATTAAAIATQIGLLREGGRVIEGTKLERMSDEQLCGEIDGIDVFARVSPHHKVRIVEALQASGHVVAMTGDGVNDAPALKRADIGISMGITGTDVAKQTADMVLTDDNYASIVAAIEQGRVIYANIRKTITYLLSCNLAEIGILFVAVLLGWPAPLTAIQLLWLNLVTDGAPALALAMEKGEPGIMRRAPRRSNERIIDRRMAVALGFQSTALAAVVLSVFALARLGAWAVEAGTLAFATLVLAELIRAYVARSEQTPLVRLGVGSNRWMVLATLSSFALVLVVLYGGPIATAFETVPLRAEMWAVAVPFALAPALAIEARKAWVNRKPRSAR